MGKLKFKPAYATGAALDLAGLDSPSSAATYIDKVLSYSPIAYWPLNETAGTTATCLINPAQNGTYRGVVLGQTVTDTAGVSFLCPYFDGSGDNVDIYTTTFRNAFSGLEGAFMVWWRVYNIGVWTDGVDRYSVHLRADADNRVMHRKQWNGGSGDFYIYEANNDYQWYIQYGYTSTDWNHSAISWSDSANQVIYYRNGTPLQTDAPGTWAGQLAVLYTTIGSFDNFPQGPNSSWYGWLAHVAVWDTPLTGPQISDLATI